MSSFTDRIVILVTLATDCFNVG